MDMNEMQQLHQKMQEMQEKLDEIEVAGEAENGLVKVVMTANREVKSISFDDSVINDGDKEQIEDLTTVAMNRALKNAEQKSEEEMRNIAGGMLPNMPGS